MFSEKKYSCQDFTEAECTPWRGRFKAHSQEPRRFLNTGVKSAKGCLDGKVLTMDDRRKAEVVILHTGDDEGQDQNI